MIMWILMALMAIVAVGFAIRPLLPERRVPLPAIAGVFVLVMSFVLYDIIGSPDIPSADPDREMTAEDIEEMVAALAARLESTPEDVQGWRMLGRSYMQMGRYDEAVDAYRRIVDVEEAQNSASLVDLGEALIAASDQQLDQEAVSAFESALSIEPGNPTALFWTGIASANMGNTDEAATRWEKLLASNPPPEIRTILEQRIAQWRGVPAENASVVTTVNISLADGAAAGLPGDTTVFVIARDPRQPMPPVAVTRRQLSELPAAIQLGDRDAMIPGRVLSALPEVEFEVRVSISGEPAAQPGDWFARGSAAPGSQLQLVISEQIGE